MNKVVSLSCVHSWDLLEDMLHQIKESKSRKWKMQGPGSKDPIQKRTKGNLQTAGKGPA